jgi:hypothetical protein
LECGAIAHSRSHTYTGTTYVGAIRTGTTYTGAQVGAAYASAYAVAIRTSAQAVIAYADTTYTGAYLITTPTHCCAHPSTRAHPYRRTRSCIQRRSNGLGAISPDSATNRNFRKTSLTPAGSALRSSRINVRTATVRPQCGFCVFTRRASSSLPAACYPNTGLASGRTSNCIDTLAGNV